MRLQVILFLTLLSLKAIAWAHPIPDIPVRSNLENDILEIQIELDLRCFEQDPEAAPYLLYKDLKKWGEISKNTAFKLAENYIDGRIQLIFSDSEDFLPTYSFSFVKLGGGVLKEDEDVVVVAAKVQRKIVKNGVTFAVKATMNNELGVEVINQINGVALPRKVSLFPGEKSYEWALRLMSVKPKK